MKSFAYNAEEPRVGLLAKLGSLIVHYQELNSPKGHPNDRDAIKSIEEDGEVQIWLKAMQPFLPVKR